MAGLRPGIVERGREADPVEGRLRDAANRRRRLEPEQVEDRRDHVDDVRVVGAHLPLARDSLRPGDDERVGGAAAVGLPLPAPERGVARPRPTPRVVVEVLRPADLVDQLQALLDRLLRVVEELRLVGRPGRPTLGGGAVVGDHHDQRVLELPEGRQELEQSADLVVGVLEEAGEHLHHPGVQPPCGVGQRVPVGHVRVVARELGVGGNDPELLLAGERLLPVGIPAVVERTGVPVGPLLPDVMRGVRGAEAEVEVERLVRIGLLAVGDERDRLVDQVLAQVVALLGLLRRLDRVVVVDEIRIPLARVATEEAVEALEAPAERPAVVRPGGGLLVARRQMPLPDHERAVAVVEQRLREHSVLERHHAVIAGIARCELRDARHSVGVMVAAGHDARPARRAERRRVHVVVAQPFGGDAVQVRRADRAAVAAQLAESGVVEHDEQDVRRALGGAHRSGPGGARLLGGAADHPRERCSRLVLDDWHAAGSDPLARGAPTRAGTRSSVQRFEARRGRYAPCLALPLRPSRPSDRSSVGAGVRGAPGPRRGSRGRLPPGRRCSPATAGRRAPRAPRARRPSRCRPSQRRRRPSPGARPSAP